MFPAMLLAASIGKKRLIHCMHAPKDKVRNFQFQPNLPIIKIRKSASGYIHKITQREYNYLKQPAIIAATPVLYQVATSHVHLYRIDPAWVGAGSQAPRFNATVVAWPLSCCKIATPVSFAMHQSCSTHLVSVLAVELRSALVSMVG